MKIFSRIFNKNLVEPELLLTITQKGQKRELRGKEAEVWLLAHKSFLDAGVESVSIKRSGGSIDNSLQDQYPILKPLFEPVGEPLFKSSFADKVPTSLRDFPQDLEVKFISSAGELTGDAAKQAIIDHKFSIGFLKGKTKGAKLEVQVTRQGHDIVMSCEEQVLSPRDQDLD